MKVLIVEDSAVMRKLIERALIAAGASAVFTADNGRRALELFAAEKPDLITMDVFIPEVNGLACIREMRSADPNARIIVVSTVRDPEIVRLALAEGAKGFLDKPFTPEQLQDAITKALA